MINISSPFSSKIGFTSMICSADAISDLRSHEIDYANQIKSKKRLAEFVSGRQAVRLASKQIGQNIDVDLLPGPERFPLWPKALTGCISHTDTMVVVAVAHKSEYISIGLDIENLMRRVNLGIEKHILSREEREWVFSTSSETKQRLLSVFSAKETIYKALFPLTKIKLTFKDANCTWCEKLGSFDCSIKRDLGPWQKRLSRMEVSCLVLENFVLTALAIEAP